MYVCLCVVCCSSCSKFYPHNLLLVLVIAVYSLNYSNLIALQSSAVILEFIFFRNLSASQAANCLWFCMIKTLVNILVCNLISISES
jgi:hypothetical protein